MRVEPFVRREAVAACFAICSSTAYARLEWRQAAAMQRRDLARSVVRDSSFFRIPHLLARTSCVNPLLLRRACRSVDHRASQTNSRGFVKHTRSFKVRLGGLIGSR